MKALRWAILLFLCALGTPPALSQSYPARPVKLVVAFPPGGPTDVVARLFAQEVSALWPAPMVVENRAGAGGLIGTEAVAKSPADGYTLLLATTVNNATAPHLYSKLPYDPQKDFTYIAPLTSTSSVLLVHPSVPAANLKELIAYVKPRRGQVNYSSPGRGLTGHLGMEMILAATGMEATEVPYKGSAPAGQALAVGEVQMTLEPMPTALNFIRAGKARAIGVTSVKRSPLLPDVPTFVELGYPKVEVTTWNGLAGPAGVPAETVERIRRDLAVVMKNAKLQERLDTMGAEPMEMAPAEFERFIRDQSARMGEVARRVNVRLD